MCLYMFAFGFIDATAEMKHVAHNDEITKKNWKKITFIPSCLDWADESDFCVSAKVGDC